MPSNSEREKILDEVREQGPDPRPALNPFQGRHGQTQDVQGRLMMIDGFDLAQCRAALQVPGLQKTVEKRLNSRIRKLEKEQNNG